MDNEILSINFKIVSPNVRSLNNSIKRRKVFKWLHRQTAHCYFLQETLSTEQSINIWRSEWDGNIFYSHGSNHSKGVMILVNPRYQLEVIRSIKDKNGRSIILEIKLDNQNLVLANVYAPNDISQQIKFYQRVSVNQCALRALSRVAAIFAYIEISVLRVLAFSEDLLRYVNDLRSGVLRNHYIIEFLYIFVFFFY